MPSLNIKRLTMCSLTTLMCTVGPNVFGHTGVQDAAEAGKRSYNAFTITHGCGSGHDDPTPLKVRGQSAVFPFGVAVWTDLSTGEVIETGAMGIVSEDDDFVDLGVGGIQDNDPFAKQEEETDDLENVRALNWKRGALKTNLLGTPRFRVSAPVILDNCVSTLRVRIAVVNWCKFGKNEGNDPVNDRSDWWFTGPEQTGSTLFVDPDLVQEDFWTTLTVNNPNAASCTGTPREVAVQPTGADIDTFLPYKPFTKGPGPY
ncbi:MAG: hypothetical protein ACREVY_14315 [Gammaproteobacteria bacterium]